MKEFVCEYQFDGDRYGLSVFAEDAQEASRRLRAIGMTGRVEGELYERIPAVPGAGLYIRAKAAVFNFLGIGRSVP